MLDLTRIRSTKLETAPYSWAQISGLFAPADAAELAATYPRDSFKTLSNRGGEKDYEYEARSLIRLGNDFVSHPKELSEAWLKLAADLLSPDYRAAMSELTSCDLSASPLEVNVFHYGPGASLGPHPDLADKMVTHILYFNRVWNQADGGCLQILRSRNAGDIETEVLPMVGNSAVLVRSDHSWHAVSRVVDGCNRSRRSVTVTLYRPGSTSSMWPDGDTTPLHRYESTPDDGDETPSARSWAQRIRGLVSGHRA
jgi:Rps23 Pro-64 3,4-dihydroxylase Tpa1-like proline 4-hydroxylase